VKSSFYLANTIRMLPLRHAPCRTPSDHLNLPKTFF
jgi:hypothetical protein